MDLSALEIFAEDIEKKRKATQLLRRLSPEKAGLPQERFLRARAVRLKKHRLRKKQGRRRHKELAGEV
jgi:hypothetical protein